MTAEIIAHNVSRYGDGWRFEFPDALIVLDVLRWREERSGPTCTVSVRCAAQSYPEHLLAPVRWHPTSMSGRQQLARTLNGAYNKAPWPQIVELVARIGLERWEDGEPVVMIGVDDVPERPAYLVDPLTLAGQINMLFGAPGALKGWMALALVLTVQEGIPVLGLPLSGARTRGLYLDCEFDEQTQARRIQALCAGAGIPRVNIAYRRCTGLLADQIEAIQRKVADVGAGFAVVDSVEAATSTYGDGDVAGPFKRLTQAVRTIPITWLFVDHDSKSAERGRETPYGTRFKQAWSRNTWLIRKSQDAGATSASVGLWHDPTSNTAPRPPLGFRFVFDGPPEAPTRVVIHREDVRDVEGFSDVLSMWQRLERLLMGGPLSAKALAAETGKAEATVKTRLHEQRRKGLALHLPDGRWALTDNEHQP